MKDSEYKYKIVENYMPLDEKQINEFAKDGWRLKTVIRYTAVYYFYLEKKIEINLVK